MDNTEPIQDNPYGNSDTPTLSYDPENAPPFTLADFRSSRVFRWLADAPDSFVQDMLVQSLDEQAKKVGFKNFPSLFRKYKTDKLQQKRRDTIQTETNRSDIQGQIAELDIGEWHATTTGGVWRGGPNNTVIVACTHPIIPVSRTRSIDTGALKYTLMWYRSERDEPSYTEIDSADMLSTTEIVKKLSPYGISVSTGDRAKALVDYLRDVTDRSYDALTEKKSVSRLGWTNDGKGFTPYVSDVAFDGTALFAPIYRAIDAAGDYSKWLTEAKEARTYSTIAKIILAASFASPLVEPLGILPFFVHIWSAASGTGKTVGQMLGASVWGNPSPGGPFFPTFNSTDVGLEVLAGFLHSLPLFIDELQLAKDRNGSVKFDVYKLASGRGRTRSNKNLGLNDTPTWANCFITSGETPMTKETDGEGALNRVFEIECGAGEKIISDGLRTANNLRQNYGWAGRDFIINLQQDGQIDRAKEIYNDFYRDCTRNGTTEKQAMAAAVMLTADKLATEYLFKDDNALTVSEISAFLKEREAVSLMDRAYTTLVDWVYVHINRMKGFADDGVGDVLGKIDFAENKAYIIGSEFDKACRDNALDPRAVKSHLRARGLIETKGRGFTTSHYLGGGRDTGTQNCICLLLPTEGEEIQQNDELPF